MFRRRLTRRGVVEGGLAGWLSAVCGAALAQTRRSGPWLITRTEYPLRLKAMMLSARQTAMATDVVLQRSDIREIRDYRNFLDTKARSAKDGIGKLDAVNTYVNTHVKRVEDYDLYSVDDVWSPPINTLTVGGDCEDIALVKFWGLRRLGFAAEDLFLVLGISMFRTPPTGHAVLGARLRDGSVQVLDILEASVIPANDLKHFEPAYALNAVGFWQVDYAEPRDRDGWRLQFQLAAGGGQPGASPPR